MNNSGVSLPEMVQAYLQAHQVITLATHGPEGLWAAAVFYVSRGFELFFLSAGHTRHARNMAANPHVAGTIQEDYRDWAAIQGIQLAATVHLLSGDGKAEAMTLYKQKFPFVARPDPAMAAALNKVNWYRLQPTQLYFIDNSKGLGHRDEIQLH